MDFKDGSSVKQEATESSTRLGRRFERKEGSDDYYIIDRRGNLQEWDQLGLIATVKRIGF